VRRGLIHHFQQWSLLHWKQMQLWRAKGGAEAMAAMFSAKHDVLASEIRARRKDSPEASEPSVPGIKSQPASVKNDTDFSADKSAAMLRLTKSRSQDQKALSTLDKRVDDQRQLAVVYGKWIGIIAGKQRAVVNYALRGIAVILVIALIGLFFDRWIESFLGKLLTVVKPSSP
jgi:hypothetical protein